MASNGSDRPPSPAKGIGSLARKQSDVTPRGNVKMKFTPTLPLRRKKTDEPAKPDGQPAESSTAPRGRGRGRGGGRGAAPREAASMTASGPFALGPSTSNQGRRNNLRTEGGRVAAGAGGSSSSKQSQGTDQVKEEPQSQSLPPKVEESTEEYSDPEDGVEIIDIEQVGSLDWMAPDVLRKGQGLKSVKREAKAEVEIVDAIDQSEPEVEEDSEDLIEHFSHQNAAMEVDDEPAQHEKIYFFQFPSPFPTFEAASTEVVDDVEMIDPPGTSSKPDKGKGVDRSGADKTKRVSFASDTKPAIDVDKDEGVVKEEDKTTTATVNRGRIGQLEVYENGSVKMRIGNMVMDVTAGTPSSFHQEAVHLNPVTKRLVALGSISKRFMVSPDIDLFLKESKEGEGDKTAHVP